MFDALAQYAVNQFESLHVPLDIHTEVGRTGLLLDVLLYNLHPIRCDYDDMTCVRARFCNLAEWELLCVQKELRKQGIARRLVGVVEGIAQFGDYARMFVSGSDNDVFWMHMGYVFDYRAKFVKDFSLNDDGKSALHRV